MTRKSKNYRLIVNHSATKKQGSLDSSGSEEVYFQRPPSRNHRKVRKSRLSTEDILYRTKDSHEESSKSSQSNEDSPDHSSYHLNVVDAHHHRKKKVHISLRPLTPRTIDRRVPSDTCHKGVEPRGYQPFIEPEFKGSSNSPCLSEGETSFCRDHIYRPLKQPIQRFDDEFINKLGKRCKEDKKRSCEVQDRKTVVHDQHENEVKQFYSDHGDQLHCGKNPEEQLKRSCNEDVHFKMPIRHCEIKIISTCKKTQKDYKIVVWEKREDRKNGCENETQQKHLFPFQKTSNGQLKLDLSKICYHDEKMCILVADHSKTKVQVKSTLGSVNRKAKSDLCGGNEQTLTAKKLKQCPCPEPIANCPGTTIGRNEIPVRDCRTIRDHYENVRKRL